MCTTVLYIVFTEIRRWRSGRLLNDTDRILYVVSIYVAICQQKSITKFINKIDTIIFDMSLSGEKVAGSGAIVIYLFVYILHRRCILRRCGNEPLLMTTFSLLSFNFFFDA
jgi:hypothetical protein